VKGKRESERDRDDGYKVKNDFLMVLLCIYEETQVFSERKEMTEAEKMGQRNN
jgi:hypothetical protein